MSRTIARPAQHPSSNESALRRRGADNRSTLATAAGTAVSRVTGLLRLVMVAYALGGGRLADAFNLANNTPNMIHDLVLGGVLAATFVPVFVDRLARFPAAQAERSIAAVITASLLLLIGATAVFELAAPVIIDLYTLGSATPGEHALAVTLLRWFAPQLLCYGVISLISALLATRHRFAAVGLAPVANNLVATGVLAAFAALAGHHPTVAQVNANPHLVVLLGLGTTLGVAVQALCLLPSLRRAGLSLRPVLELRDPAVRTIVQLAGWTLGFVAANQIAVFVVLALEFHTGPGGVSAYTYAYTFFQLPFGVVAVSVVNVATPALARLYSEGRLRELGMRFGLGARQVLALVLPSAVGYLVLARQIVPLVIGHGAERAAQASTTAATLAMFALGLPGFCIFLLAIRAFQAMQDTRTAFVLYVLENGTNILAALLLYRTPLGVRGLALAYSIAYTLAALVALAVLRERLGTIGGRSTLPRRGSLPRLEPADGRSSRLRLVAGRQRGGRARLGTPVRGRGGRRVRLPRWGGLRGHGARLADFPPPRPGSHAGGRGRTGQCQQGTRHHPRHRRRRREPAGWRS